MGEPGDEAKYITGSELAPFDPDGINPESDWNTAIHDRNQARRLILQRLDVLLASLGIISVPEEGKLAELSKSVTLGSSGVSESLSTAINTQTRAVAALAQQVKRLVDHLESQHMAQVSAKMPDVVNDEELKKYGPHGPESQPAEPVPVE